MYCHKCGTSLADTATACPSCNEPAVRAAPSRASAMAGSVKAAYSSGLAALKGFVGDPVGRLPQVYESLGEERALRIGITYGVVSVLGFLLGGYLLFPFKDGLFERLGVSGVLRGVVFSAIPFGCAVVGGLATRKVFGGQGGKGGDVFVAGAALLPASFAMVINGLLGLSHTGLATAISVFAGCTGVLMLFSGYSRVAKLSERAATLAVPIVVVLTLWVGRSMASSVIESAIDASVRGSSSERGWNVSLGFSNNR
jgi:hypothetical protein